MDEGRLVGRVDREECTTSKIELLMVSEPRGPNGTYLIKEFCNLLSKRPLREEEVCESKLIFFFLLCISIRLFGFYFARTWTDFLLHHNAISLL